MAHNIVLHSFLFTDCGKNASVTNGHVNFTNAVTTYGHFVPVTCDAGYRLTGGSKIECLADGTWSDTVTCEVTGGTTPYPSP